MKKILYFLILINILSLATAGGQTKWIIEVKVPPSTPEDASLFIAGNFNAWDPGNPDHQFIYKGENTYSLALDLEQQNVEFKFTLGSWNSVEVMANGQDIDNREELLEGEHVKRSYEVKAWRSPVHHKNISGDVRVIEDFHIPQLDRTRRIWVYLPPGYERSTKKYPVLYMHDGQNLFADSTSFSGEWGVDETLEEMIADKRIPKIIVVGIDNSPYRLSEYSPFDFDYKGLHKGEAKQYGQFIVETLKPYIDEHFRTKPGRRHTAISGSSMGGLVSVYIAIEYQDIFSKVGALSSSFGVCRDDLLHFIETHPRKYPIRFWLDLGSEESDEMEYDVNQIPVIEALNDAGWKKDREVKFTLYDGARHHERFWRERFNEVLLYLFK